MPIYDPKDDFDQPGKPVKRTPSPAELYMIALQNLEKTRTNKTPAVAASAMPTPPSAANTSPSTPASNSEVTAQTAPATNPNPAPATNPGTSGSTSETDPMAPDPYVERCMQALRDAEKAARARGGDRHDAERAGRAAFKNTFPPLNGEENIRGFIACVTHGMILDVLSNDQATKLLYAAQVAHTACRRHVAPARSPGRPRHESPQESPASSKISHMTVSTK